MSGPLCTDVLDRHDAGEVLHRIYTDRRLVIPLDRRESAYRMHGLLRDALAIDLERRNARAARETHRRASSGSRRRRHRSGGQSCRGCRRLRSNRTARGRAHSLLLRERPVLDDRQLGRVDPTGSGGQQRPAVSVRRRRSDRSRRCHRGVGLAQARRTRSGGAPESDSSRGCAC